MFGFRNAFGATSPPFIDYLKDILRRYPDGGQILKVWLNEFVLIGSNDNVSLICNHIIRLTFEQELIQNADDAGASEVVFIHDERTYEKDSLLSEDLGKYQGT